MLQNMTAPIDILFVIAPHSLLLDIAGPAEAFRLVNTDMPNTARDRSSACGSPAR